MGICRGLSVIRFYGNLQGFISAIIMGIYRGSSRFKITVGISYMSGYRGVNILVDKTLQGYIWEDFFI